MYLIGLTQLQSESTRLLILSPWYCHNGMVPVPRKYIYETGAEHGRKTSRSVKVFKSHFTINVHAFLGLIQKANSLKKKKKSKKFPNTDWKLLASSGCDSTVPRRELKTLSWQPPLDIELRQHLGQEEENTRTKLLAILQYCNWDHLQETCFVILKIKTLPTYKSNATSVLNSNCHPDFEHFIFQFNVTVLVAAHLLQIL